MPETPVLVRLARAASPHVRLHTFVGLRRVQAHPVPQLDPADARAEGPLLVEVARHTVPHLQHTAQLGPVLHVEAQAVRVLYHARAVVVHPLLLGVCPVASPEYDFSSGHGRVRRVEAEAVPSLDHPGVDVLREDHVRRGPLAVGPGPEARHDAGLVGLRRRLAVLHFLQEAHVGQALNAPGLAPRPCAAAGHAFTGTAAPFRAGDGRDVQQVLGEDRIVQLV
mmetsp:Transcript_82395/g.233676  ORF Transcript_82395/g.233676 Transcript_82395/m.233676 type:complete len:223 (+) Transcript_82395:954-1622(+)